MGDIVNKEQVLIEFDNWASAMDLDFDIQSMDAEDKAAFENQRKKMLREILRGHLIFNDDGEAVYTPQNKKSKDCTPLTFKERTGSALMAMDRQKKGHDISKTYAMMAEMCGVHQKVFAGLVGTDIKVCEAIFALLMD